MMKLSTSTKNKTKSSTQSTIVPVSTTPASSSSLSSRTVTTSQQRRTNGTGNGSNRNGKYQATKQTTAATTIPCSSGTGGGSGDCCCCGIHCVCNVNHHCDCYEELCQSRAYHMIQSVQEVENNTIHITTPTTLATNRNKKPKDPVSHNDDSSNDNTWKVEVLVRGMTCTMCSQAVETAIRKAFSTNRTILAQKIDISLITDIVTIEWITTTSNQNHTSTTSTTTTNGEFYTDMIRQAITAIGYDVEEIQILQFPRMMNGENRDEENPPTTITASSITPNNNNTTMSVEDRWQRYRQRQVDKVGQRRCAFLVAMILTLPILMITMVLPYVIPHLFQQYQNRMVTIPYLHWTLPIEGLVLWIFATPVQFVCGYEFYKMAWYGFWSGNAGMDLLVALGTTASYLYALHGVLWTTHKNDNHNTHHTDTAHFFETSTILIVFVLAGKWMQAAAVRRTSDAITQLMSLQSPTAIRIIPTSTAVPPLPDQPQRMEPNSTFNPLYHPYIEEIVNVQDIMVGDMVKVIRGASIPVDGTVLFGDIAVDESMMTGESLPIVKMKGSFVLGGTVCVESGSNNDVLTPTRGSSRNPNFNSGSVGAAFIQVTGVGSSSALAKIVDLVQQAQSRAVPIQSFADQVSAIFVPTVCAISLLTYLVWYALCSSNVVPVEWYRDELGEDSVTFSLMFAIACLVISCPCALGLATPTAIMVGTGVGAKCGILMKGGSALEIASKVNTVIFDKTGTLVRTSMLFFLLKKLPMFLTIDNST